MQKQKMGKMGEDIALKYLRKHGYKFIAQNFRKRCGEIDLIVRKKKTIVFIEVKTRKDYGFGGAFDSVDEYKLKKLMDTAELFLLGKDRYDDFAWRLDVIEVVPDFYKKKARLKHWKDIFID